MPTIEQLMVDALNAVKNKPDKSRELSLAITKLEEALMWYQKSVSGC